MKWPTWFCAVLIAVAMAARADETHEYDFAYHATGDMRINPIQVFDDGRRTYFQLRSLEPMPAIFAVTAAGQVLLTGRVDKGYLVVDRVEKQWLLTLSSSTKTRITYSGAARARRSDPPIQFGSADARSVGGMAPVPVPADQVKANHTILAMVPRSDDVSDPANPAQIPPPSPPSAAASVPEKWEVRLDDKTIATTLSRWAVAAGWAFSWEAPRDFPVTVPAAFSESFERAVSDVVVAFSNSDSPIKAEFAKFGPNKVLRIIKYEGNSGNKNAGRHAQ